MKFLELKIPPPLVTIAFALAIWWISTTTPVFEINVTLRIFASVFALGLGLFFAVAGLVSLKNAKTTVSPFKPEESTSLVSSGIYQVSRYPMYLALSLVLVALTIYLSAPFGLIGVFGFI